MKDVKLILCVIVICFVSLFCSCDFIIESIIYGDDDFYDDFDDKYENDDDESDHTCIFGEWEIVLEPTCSSVGEKIRECEICFDVDTLTMPKIGHTVVIDQAEEPHDSLPGKTEGQHCSVCGTVIVRQEYIYSEDFTDPSKYSSDYAYNYILHHYENGAALQSFYNSIDVAAEQFHVSLVDAKSKIISNTELYFAAEIDYSSFGIEKDEAIAVWNAYKFDHPLYYWMSNNVSTTNTTLTLIIFEEYSSGEVRSDYNSLLYSEIEEYVEKLDGRGSPYEITLSFHDNIILSAEYAYEADGVTPEDDAFAHNALGVLIFGKGVCESYTKAFQLLLNYCGLENIYVSGYAGEPHAWNLVKLDNGEWYWFDLTWDDKTGNGLGVKYNYFCVNDTDNVKGETFATFLDDHTPDAVSDYGTDFMYAIPDRADESFVYDGIVLINDVVEIDGLTYVICGADSCALVKIAVGGDVIVPETITYNGFDFEVSIIANFEEGRIDSGSVIVADEVTFKTPNITSIFIPKTVKVIWDYAFIRSKTVERFTVDEQNSVYASENGVLFTKNLYTLVQYPLGAKNTSYEISSSTVEIAYGAFGDGGNVFYPKHLDTLIVGKNVTVFGACHFGRGYRDEMPLSSSEIVMIDGYFEIMKKYLGAGLVIEG